MILRSLCLATLVCLAIIAAIAYPLHQEFKHAEYMRQQRIMDYTGHVMTICAAAWPQKEERFHTCVNDALKAHSRGYSTALHRFPGN